MERVTVLSIGCVLMGDEGIGAYVLESLKATYDFPPNVELLDAGTPGHDLTLFMEHRDVLVVIDAVKVTDATPGEVRVYEEEDLAKKPPTKAMSPHEPGFIDAILKLRFTGGAPKNAVLVGVVPKEIDTQTKLSEAVLAAVPAAMEQVVAQLRRFGVIAVKKEAPGTPDIWWNTRN